jgi:uncharacterized protein involved in exopolysaccharide biosynthesis
MPKESVPINLLEFTRYYFKHWGASLALLAICLLAAVVYQSVSTPVYRAQVTLQFRESLHQGEGLGSASGIGLALAGLQSDRNVPERSRAFGVLRSRAFLVPFMSEMKLAEQIFPTGFSGTGGDVKRVASRPTDSDLYKAFLDRTMKIDDNSATGLIVVSIFMPDPLRSSTTANELIAKLNAQLQNDSVSQAKVNIRYLNEQLSANQIAEIRAALAQLVQSEMRRLLQASGRTTQVFSIVDPATTPDRVYSPRWVLVFAFALFTALILSFLVSVVRLLINGAAEEIG